MAPIDPTKSNQINPYIAAMYNQNQLQNSQPLIDQTKNQEFKVDPVSFRGAQVLNPFETPSIDQQTQVAPVAAQQNYLNGRAPAEIRDINLGNGAIGAQKLSFYA